MVIRIILFGVQLIAVATYVLDSLDVMKTI